MLFLPTPLAPCCLLPAEGVLSVSGCRIRSCPQVTFRLSAFRTPHDTPLRSDPPEVNSPSARSKPPIRFGLAAQEPYSTKRKPRSKAPGNMNLDSLSEKFTTM